MTMATSDVQRNRASKIVATVNFHGVGKPARELEPGEDRYWIEQDEMFRILDLIVGRLDVEVTCDDGNLSDLIHLAPALVDRNLTGTFFVLAGRIGESGSLGTGDIQELQNLGMKIGLHGYSHVSWRGLDEEKANRELGEARHVIEDVAGHSVTSAAIPFGDYDRTTLGRLKQFGFQEVFTSDKGWSKRETFPRPRNSVGTGCQYSEVKHLLEHPRIGLFERVKRIVKRCR